MSNLQIEIDDQKVGLKLTPIDLPIPDAAAQAIKLAIAAGDMADAIPGDGQLEENQHLKFPVKVNLFFTKLNVTIDEEVELIVRVKDTAATEVSA